MKKRGSLNLSINAIVVLILAITMLGLGLAFMRNIFGGATEEFQQTTGEIEKQMIEQMKDSTETISLNRPKVNIKIGSRQQIFIGLKNDQQETMEFIMDRNSVQCTASGGDRSRLNCFPNGDVDIEWIEAPISIKGGEVEVLPINLKVKTTANEGTCFCTIDVNAGGETKRTSFSVDVIV